MKVSIDIGTSYSCICRINEEGKPEAIETQTCESLYGNKYSMPSAVFVENDGKVIVGQAAINRRNTSPMNFKAEFKRYLGQNVPIHLGGRDFMPEDLYAEMFRHFISCAKKYRNEEIEKAYITCPASFREAKKERIIKAAGHAGLLDVELIDEPTAAARYCCTESNIKMGDIALVYDFGGGTFDASVLKRTENGFVSMTPALGIPNCGGIDIDRMIYNRLYDHIKSRNADALASIEKNEKIRGIFFGTLEESAVKIKHTLSSFDSATESVTLIFDIYDFTLTRNELNNMIASLVSETIECCRSVLKNASVETAKLSAVFMVGGTSRIPLVREMLEMFAPNVPIITVHDPDLAVAQGAACTIVDPKPHTPLKDTLKCEPEKGGQGTTKIAENGLRTDLMSGFYRKKIMPRYGVLKFKVDFPDHLFSYAEGTTLLFFVNGKQVTKLVTRQRINSSEKYICDFRSFPQGEYDVVVRVFSYDDPKCEGDPSETRATRAIVKENKTTEIILKHGGFANFRIETVQN